MKIGVYLTGYEPQSGGGYTFESDLFAELLLHVNSVGSERFCLIVPEENVTPKFLELLPPSLQVVKVRTKRFMGRFLALLASECSFYRAHSKSLSPLDRAAKSVGIDFIWFLAAGNHRTDIPYLTVVWDLQHRATPWFPEFSAKGMWDRRELNHRSFLQRAAAIITGTEQGKIELKKYYEIDEEKILLLPHPTPSFALKAGEAKEDVSLNLGVEGRYILYPAQFWPHKNHINLLEAMDIYIKNGGPALTLVCVGSDKGNREFVEQAAKKLDIENFIKFLGFVSRAQLIALYKNAVALTYASYCGPENLPPLEAFAIGCPVLASNIPGAKEQFGDAAILFSPENPEEIALKIRILVEDDELRSSLIARGRIRAEQWTTKEYITKAVSYLNKFSHTRKNWP